MTPPILRDPRVREAVRAFTRATLGEAVREVLAELDPADAAALRRVLGAGVR